MTLCTTATRGDIRLPAIFSEHMVLQSNAAVPIWGWADPGEEVTVAFAGQTKTATADARGKWLLKLDKLKTTDDPQTLTVKGRNTLVVGDVLVGEVWLGSGQSNMTLPVERAANATEEIAAANDPKLRMFTEASTASDDAPQQECKGAWALTNPASVPAFSATAYYFGRELRRTLGVPVGLVHSSVGGTPIESWISAEAQQHSPELKTHYEQQVETAKKFDPEAAQHLYEKDLARWKEEAKQNEAKGFSLPPGRPNDPLALRKEKGGFPGGLFNGKIAPLIPYAIRGVIWYQGESNAGPDLVPLYEAQMSLLIHDWRARWGDDDLPFAWVQLPNISDHPSRDWPPIREAMLKTLKLKNTGMAITIDIGEAADIHPKNKQEVGRRLSLWALGQVYGRDVPSTSGPLPAGQELRGDKIVLNFSHADKGLVAKGGELIGFFIAESDQQWKPGLARIEGNQVLVWNPYMQHPVAVRYSWSNNPYGNLYNCFGLPASPFRTDDWKEPVPSKASPTPTGQP